MNWNLAVFRFFFFFFFVVVVACFGLGISWATAADSAPRTTTPEGEIYSDQWAVRVSGGAGVADQVARTHGFVSRGQILSDYYHFVHRKVAKRSTEANDEHHSKLVGDPNVKWAQQQTVKRRAKRDFRERGALVVKTALNDPRWPQMWYLNRGGDLDMNVQKAWVQGVTGKGVVVTILDDGLEKDHPDIKRNYDPLASYDVNNHDEDPQPRYDLIDSNRHGTRCAGEVAADANNSICAVGVAYDASVGGVRMLDGDVTDAVEARSLSLNPQHIDIYSASWGPDDDGKTVDGPGELATRAFIEGIIHGRNGMGSIFVWASGNGGRDYDNCNCDGYTNSIWTLSISSATENGLVPWYSEACSSTLATTYSSGSSGEKQVITTDLHHGCTSSHTGTSASAPLAAGICALALQINRRLTWRDMQHIVVRSARPANLQAHDWAMNGNGRNVSHSFGYGLMDASLMVDLAKDWVTVPDQKVCEVRTPQKDKLIPAKSAVKLQVDVNCPDVQYLEHVQAKITMAATRRGDIQIFLISPSGTRSTLLAIRPHDTSRDGFQAWPFMSVHCWGENPTGTWTLEIHSEGRYQGRATLEEWLLVFYGTTEEPDGRRATSTSTSTTSTTSTSTTTTRPTTTTTAVAATSTTISTTVTSASITTSPVALFFPPRPVWASNGEPKEFADNNVLLHDGNPPKPASKQSLQNGAASVSDWNLILYGTKENPERSKQQPQQGGSRVSSQGCVRSSSTGACLECGMGYQMVGESCVIQCPERTFPSTGSQMVGETQQQMEVSCRQCHYTCLTCDGPNDYQCLSCFGDAVLEESNMCHPLSLHSALRDARNWYIGMTVVFFVMAAVILGLVVCLLRRRSNYKPPKYASLMRGEDIGGEKKTPSGVKPYTDGADDISGRLYSDSADEI